MLSAFGIEHGDQVSKAQDKYAGHGAPTPGRRVSAYAFGPFHSAVAGKPGKKLRATGNQLGGAIGGNLAGATAGGLAGGLLGLAARKPKMGQQLGANLGALGGAAGAIGGGQLAVNRNQRQGYYKKQRKGAF